MVKRDVRELQLSSVGPDRHAKLCRAFHDATEHFGDFSYLGGRFALCHLFSRTTGVSKGTGCGSAPMSQTLQKESHF